MGSGRSRVAALGAAVLTVVIGACSGGSATAQPTASASAAGSGGSSAAPASASAAPASASAGAIASFALPSAIASALASAGTVKDAATLLTPELAASVLGGSPTKTTLPVTIPNVSIVSYRTEAGDSLTLYIQAVPGGVANAELQAAIAMAGAHGDLQTVSGIGDAAGKVVNANDATVAFIKGSNLVVVAADSSATAGTDLEPKVESVAKQVAGQL